MSLALRSSADGEEVKPPLGQAVGYVVVVVIGLVIAFSRLDAVDAGGI